MHLEDVVIIGAGPAGVSAAIQLARFGIKPLVFEKNAIGGLLRNANRIENYPGFPDGIRGLELVELIERQGKKWAINIQYDEVLELDKSLRIKTRNCELRAKFVIIASGTKPVIFDDFVIPDSAKKSIFYEIYPLRDARSCNIAIVGGGDAAFDYAINLSKNNTIMIFNRSSKIKALPILQSRVSSCSKIQYHDNMSLRKIEQSGAGRLRLSFENAEARFEADALMFAIGRQPELGFADNRIESENVYYCGDVRNGDYRQLAIACGEGIKAAMQICEMIRKGRI